MKFEQIGNIVTIHKGRKHEITDECLSSSKRVLQIDDLRNDNLIKYTNDKKGVLANEDDLMIVWDGANAGTIGYGKNGYIGSTIAVLRKKQSHNYSTTFLGKFLQSQFYYLRKNATGATIPHIDRKSLESLKVPVIGINDQIHIANLLSKAENLIKQRKESIRLLDEFLKSTFLEMFGDPGTNPHKWQIEKLKNSFLDKPLIGSMVPAIDFGTIPIVRVGELGKRDINFERCKFSNLGEDDQNKYLLKDGDILLARAIGSESHLGKASIFIDKGLPVVYDSHVMRIRFNKNRIHPEYFYTFLQTQGGRRRFMCKAGQTAVQFNINSKQISDIDIPFPPNTLQTQFAQIVEKTEALKVQYQNSLQELEHLYGSLSQRAFKGELLLKTEEDNLPLAAEPETVYKANKQSSIPELIKEKSKK